MRILILSNIAILVAIIMAWKTGKEIKIILLLFLISNSHLPNFKRCNNNIYKDSCIIVELETVFNLVKWNKMDERKRNLDLDQIFETCFADDRSQDREAFSRYWWPLVISRDAWISRAGERIPQKSGPGDKTGRTRLMIMHINNFSHNDICIVVFK